MTLTKKLSEDGTDEPLWKHCRNNRKTAKHNHEPVSYTHLDVYKRQDQIYAVSIETTNAHNYIVIIIIIIDILTVFSN